MHTHLARVLLRHRHRKRCIAALKDKIAQLQADIRAHQRAMFALSRELLDRQEELEALKEDGEEEDDGLLSGLNYDYL